MKLSLKWLADYVALPQSVDELAKKLTMAGLEIEGISKPGDALRGVIVAKIVSSEKHPNADKLSVTKIDDGSGTLGGHPGRYQGFEQCQRKRSHAGQLSSGADASQSAAWRRPSERVAADRPSAPAPPRSA